MDKIMTREEYEAKIKILQAEYKCDSDYYQSLCDLDSKYIASIEAQNQQLTQDNLDLMKQVEHYMGDWI